MKFSWKMLNDIIHLEAITFKKFIYQLTLAGFEVEEIEENNEIIDKIINLSITANRKEVCCLVKLAQEINTILNTTLKPQIKPLKYINKYIVYPSNKLIKESKQINYIKINTIYNLKNNKSPIWLQHNLIACDIKPLFLIYDIQAYIKIKWGHSIHIIDLKKLKTQFIDLNIIEIQQNLQSEYSEKILYNKQELFNIKNSDIESSYLEYNNQTENIILFHITYKNNPLINSQDTCHNAYEDFIKLISTLGQGIINKSYENINITSKSNKRIKIKKQEIQYTLGTLNNEQFKYLSNKQILLILNKLQLQPKYSKNTKIFTTIVPKHRQHDLQRNIDIIEEIGRIYGFKYFLNKLPKYKNKGTISFKSLYIKKIRQILLNIGLNEVIHSSLIKNIEYHNKNSIEIYNPLTEENKILRFNLLYNLIETYKNNIKNQNFRNEIFEIGQIFYINHLQQYTENTHLGILINNHNFYKKDWSNKPENLEWFHAKAIIEIFLNKLKIKQIKWINSNDYSINISLNNSNKYFQANKKAFIYNTNSKEIIGIFGQLNNQHLNYTTKNKQNTYICEININKLIQNIYFSKHINYNINRYSIYPSITRDISIDIDIKTNIDKIKYLILKENIHLIESIQIINEYYNKLNNVKSICLRFIYRDKNKTLNNKDIENINQHLKELISKINKNKLI
uniref:phenylalanine--tRNA ligase n=1 Tax=Dasya binghamiae TaxID=1896963 RepID=A0A1C8XS42_9FLOR|nr:phenylalanyl-tRNA synthetase beta chain [Dasya binghamiae]AOH77247.1 phenylalanyl-tRNA synthetase beta chain [Dasya binghamiae]